MRKERLKVVQLSTKVLREKLQNASGTERNKIYNELQKRSANV